MFGPRITKVFASRLHALWWSAMVLVTAYCVAADPPAQVAPPPDAAAATADEKAPDPWAHIDDDAPVQADNKPADPWAGMKDVARQRQELLP
ncbi:MAG: hypothetical protein COA41_19830 [Sphingopyxis sp.]|nr:MAG: hypothetical protein COA41_19830 [Sphingopyxis sp.]